MITTTVLMGLLLLLAVALLYCAACEIRNLRQDVAALTRGWNNATRTLEQYKALHRAATRELKRRGA